MEPLPKKFHPEKVSIFRPDTIIDLSYQGLFLVWIGLVISFGIIYFTLTLIVPAHGLVPMEGYGPLDTLLSSMYFSVITATSVGYGDIVPVGIAKLLASIQSILTIFISAIFVTKLISYRQEIALYQVHKLTFEGNFYNTREGFFIIRQDFDHMLHELEKGRSPDAEAWETWSIALKQGQSLLDEILEFYDDQSNMYTIDLRREQLLLEAVHRTLMRLHKLLVTFKKHKIKVDNHVQAADELRSFVHVFSNIMPIWHERSPYDNADMFERIILKAKDLSQEIIDYRDV